MENAMSRRKGKKLIIFIGIAIFIVLLIFFENEIWHIWKK
mgnify:CR=1 FL=1